LYNSLLLIKLDWQRWDE